MQHILVVHCLKSFGYLVKSPADELFWEFSLLTQDKTCHWATFHELKENKNAVIIVVNLLTANESVAVQKQNQTTFIDDVLSLDHVFWRRGFHGKQFIISQSLALKYCTEGSLTKFFLLYDFVIFRWIFIFHIARFSENALNLRKRTEARHLLPCLNENGAKSNLGMLNLEAFVVESQIKHDLERLRKASPIKRAIIANF